tara:strand:+ start:4961 stop:5152 length:192 start_codon:yes stop_codon:yes gene_type:complete
LEDIHKNKNTNDNLNWIDFFGKKIKEKSKKQIIWWNHVIHQKEYSLSLKIKFKVVSIFSKKYF